MSGTMQHAVERSSMDVPRRREPRRTTAYAVVVVLVLGAVAWFGVRQLGTPVPQVERAGIWIDEVRRGALRREIVGVGALVPAEVRWVAAGAGGYVERVLVRPGALVKPDTIVAVLSNPGLIQEAELARLDHEAALAGLRRFEVELSEEVLEAESAMADQEAGLRQAELELRAHNALRRQGLISGIEAGRAELRAEQLREGAQLERQRVALLRSAREPRMAEQAALAERSRRRLEFLRQRVAHLEVRAGVAGVFQRQTAEVGMLVEPGQAIAQVADATSFRAEIRIAEHEAREVRVGQAARIGLRTQWIDGTVAGVHPTVENGTVAVDVRLQNAELPEGVRRDLTVEGRIEIENVLDVLYVKRPASIRAGDETTLFRLEGQRARRTRVRLGRTSAEVVEVISGLRQGDRVIVSDTSAWATHSEVRVK